MEYSIFLPLKQPGSSSSMATFWVKTYLKGKMCRGESGENGVVATRGRHSVATLERARKVFNTFPLRKSARIGGNFP